jgi:hypothetical protein
MAHKIVGLRGILADDDGQDAPARADQIDLDDVDLACPAMGETMSV